MLEPYNAKKVQMFGKSETNLRHVFSFSATGGVAYWCGAYEGPFKWLSQYFAESGWVSLLLIPSLFGAAIGLAIAYSAHLCFPEERNRKSKRLLIAGAVGGALFWGMRSLGMFYFVGLIIFALVLGLSSGGSVGTKLRRVLGMFLGGLLGLGINGLPADVIFSIAGTESARDFLDSDLFKRYTIAALALEGYLTNLGLLLGYQARVKLIWYGGLMGFLLASLATPFLLLPRVASLEVLVSTILEVVVSTMLGGGIGFLLDRLLKSGINNEKAAAE